MSWDQERTQPERRWRPVNLTGPLILITLGLVFLMANLGILGTSPWQLLWQWWPLILIIIGLEILIGVLGRCPAKYAGLGYVLSAIVGVVVVIAALALVAYVLLAGPQLAGGPPAATPTSHFTQPRGNVSRAEVSLDLLLGTFRASALPAGTGNLLEGDFAGPDNAPPVSREYQERGGVAFLTLKSSGPRVRLGGGEAWPQGHLRLSPDVPLVLQVETVMGTLDLDLRDLRVTDLTLEGVMCTQQVQLPTSGQVVVHVAGVMSTCEITVPAGTAARIHRKGLAAITVDERRFPRRGEVHESAEFAAAANRVEITIESVMGTVRVR